jgi:3',5'-cyclic AMP phosphodiesterase CpdA
VVSIVVLIALVVFLMYRRQIVSYLTHWKGGPSTTEPYVVLSPPPEVHLAVAGDTGDSGSQLDAMSAAMAGVDDVQEFDALLLLGDNVYPSGDPDRLPATVFEPFAGVLDGTTELLAILGNHDAPNGDAQMAALGMPGRYWATTVGDDVLIVGLDSTAMDDPDQLAFLEETLSSTTATWKIVALHHPPYSAGYQGSNMTARDTFSPIFQRYGVQLVLSGHDHDYQRSVPIDGVTYVVSGAGSGTRRTAERSFTAVSYSFLHFLDIGITGDRLLLRAVDRDGRVADEVTIGA